MFSFGSLFTVCCYAYCAISCVFNGLLVCIVQQRRAGIGFYRFFTLATMLIGVTYSLAYATAQPLWLAGPGILGFFSVSPWTGNVNLIRIAYQLWFAAFVVIALCMTCSFLYRYGLLCCPKIVTWFETPRRFVVILGFLLAISIWWLYVADFLLFQDSRRVRRMMKYKFAGEYSVDFMSSYVLTVDINDEISAKRSVTGALICTTMMQSQIAIMFYCGFSIHKAVKVRAMSDRMRRIHKNALKMMIMQALNPVAFLYGPSFVNLFGMFVDADFGYLPNAIALWMPLFPIFNPLIVIYFTQEYKQFIFRRRPSTVKVTSTVCKSVDIQYSLH